VHVIYHPHPTLRHKSKPLKRVDAELKSIVRQMFDLMYEHKGIGLAANQVDLPYRLFVLNLESDSARTDLEHVFINPIISNRKGSAEAEEGCLSLPGMYAQVRRPAQVRLNAYTLAGEEVTLDLDGLFARAVQHEVDHLDGVLFIDRLPPTGYAKLRDAVVDLEHEFAARRERGEIPDEAAIAARIKELERLRT
jgi:peptide deformylase